MKTLIFIFTLLLLLYSCKKEEQKRETLISNGVQVTIRDSAGVDLLNPSNPHAYLYQNIKTYTLEHGVKTEVFKGNLQFPKDFYIHEYEGKYFMQLFLNGSLDGNFGTTYVQWEENNVDTFKYEVSTDDYNVVVTKAWYNDRLFWTIEDHSKGIRALDLVK